MKKTTKDRSTAAKIAAKRRAGRPRVADELDRMREFLKTNCQGEANEISNADLADKIYGKLKRERGEPQWDFDQRVADRTRKVRKRVQQLRKGGHPVCLAFKRHQGYFWGMTNADILATAAYFNDRATTSYAVAAKILGRTTIEQQATHAAEKLDAEQDEAAREAALQKLVERLTRNPVTRTVFLRVVGDTMSAEEKARLEGKLDAVREKLVELLAMLDGTGLGERLAATGGSAHHRDLPTPQATARQATESTDLPSQGYGAAKKKAEVSHGEG